MRDSTGFTLVSLLVSLCLSGCYLGPDTSKDTNYREKGKAATIEDIVGIWDSSLELNDGSMDIRYTAIRGDGTYREVDFEDTEEPDSVDNGVHYTDCYTFNETSITYLEDGKYLQGENKLEIYLYKGKLGLYNHYRSDFDVNDNRFFKYPSSVLEPTTLTESESTFLPVCE